MSDDCVVRVLRNLACGTLPDQSETQLAFEAILDGQTSEARTAAILALLHAHGEQIEQLVGAVHAIRSRMLPYVIPEPLRPVLDTCGAGGDGAGTFNISTAVAIVCAAAGVRIAKHGNRSASGNSGSAEVLTQLGVRIDPPTTVLDRCLAELGIVFLYAPRFHPALGPLASVRKQLPFRTLFNLIGPLANPARPDHQLVGVPSQLAFDLYRGAWDALGLNANRSAIVHGLDGLDEVSLSAPTLIAWQGPGATPAVETLEPGIFGLGRVEPEQLRVSGPAESAERMILLFQGEHGPIRNVVLANVALALCIADRSRSVQDAVELAAQAIDNGRATALLERWKTLSQMSA